ncbi:hypothetical protein NCCP1664_19650 [Zafaria cholistanensis]|uniref:Uncharacterized protein n=1 Tax=Zafaria cholistanensis TaxID=1682741 RepID=A0A5A7NRW6_9MICC|nr:hypothetical protein [Zafaria cholistanensis]GER23469.1 hypothetical protein NCCP1664_19650 [Zafaria cholistanensis]
MPKVLRFDDEPHRGAPHDGGPHDGGPGPERSGPSEGSPAVRVIVKVNTGGYVPDGFRVRTRVDEELFTAEASEADLTRAAGDPHVDSVARARPLGLD